MGTELQRRDANTTLPLWSARTLIDDPELVWTVHGDDVAAGAETVTANTFRTHARTLAKAGLEARAGELSALAVRLAAENLRNQEKRHEVGMATTKDLLDFQSRLTTARGTEVQAKTDYATAVSRWRRAQGALLREYQIVVDRGSKLPAPWFAQF